jgi:hypothetical protein
MYKISHDLKLKLLDKNKATSESHMTSHEMTFQGQIVKVPGVSWSEVILQLKGEPNLFQECEDWIEMIRSGCQDSCNFKLTMGEYEGLWPSICDRKNMKVTFLVDCFHPGRKNWRDWFLEGEEYAPQ